MPEDKALQAGIVDARNTALESTTDLLVTVEPLSDTLGDRLTVCPSAGLEFLPREKAKAKLERLVEAAKAAAA
jgi:methionine synthase II (cobalamin-independent)